MEAFLNQLRELLKRPCSAEELKEVSRSPYLEEHELAKAGFALLAKRNELPPVSLKLEPSKSGALPLFRRGFFPWGALPYPREHAELATILVELEMGDVAKKMSEFQQATFDHEKKPLLALFRQEKGTPFSDLERANRTFFEALSLPILDEYQFIDQELGMIFERTPETTSLLVGSGCKSGLGAFLHRDAGLLNFGPQLLPIDQCDGFGIAGRARHFKCSENKYSFRSRLAAPNPRQLGLSDSGYSGIWIDIEAEKGPSSLSIKGVFEGERSLAFSFFGRAASCHVAGNHKLTPHSLDRYQGPPQSIELRGENGGRVLLETKEGFSRMEVIPLAGDESYWGADFLIAFSVDLPTIAFSLCF